MHKQSAWILSLVWFFCLGFSQPQLQAQVRDGAGSLPVQEGYYHIFLHLAALNKKASEVEAQGGNGNPYRSLLAQAASLRTDQAQQLNSVATDCLNQITALDNQAKTLWQKYHQAQQDGTPAQRPDAELLKLQDQRTFLLWHYRKLSG